jgi:xanthine dehydrogenase YagT iron-sulfur-binding subunit
MASKKLPNHPPEDMHPDEGRRNFLKQSSLLTALVVTPPYLVKAADSGLDEKAAALFEQVPLSMEVNGKSYKLSVEPRATCLIYLGSNSLYRAQKKAAIMGNVGLVRYT